MSAGAMWLAGWLSLAGPAALVGSPSYHSLWFVEPSLATAEISVKRGEWVIKTRLLPPGLIELSEEVLDTEKGVVIARKGDQLFKAMPGKLRKPTPEADLGVYCTFHPQDVPAGLFGLLGSRHVSYRCFVDSDRDGRLDGMAPGACTSRAFPIIEAKVPDNPVPIRGGAYRKLSPIEIKEGPMVGIMFDGIRGSGLPSLQLHFGDGTPVPVFGSVASNGEKGQRRIFGAKISTIDGNDDAARLRIDQGIPLQPFAMVAQGCPN
ncbi:hypothetical protein ACCC88_14315 [Sphingomonas sp. Sphisp140]|uniref:hypothetical protein n=1 Tax=unclassified Sphingomonas TaxID=196159 RepID=UPI0039B11AD5